MEQPSELFLLNIDPVTKTYLAETARWARFLAIIGFIVCGLIVLIGIFFGSVFGFLARSGNNEFGNGFNGMPGAAGAIGAIGSVLYILVALLYFFPCLYLFRFANKMRTALASNAQQDLNTAFQNLKSLFRFVGILTVVILCLYALTFIGAMIAGAFYAR